MKAASFWLVLGFVAGMAVPMAAPAQAPAPAAATPPIHPYDERDWLQRFYAPRAYTPAWTREQAEAALALLQDAGAHGLAPEEYGAADVLARLREQRAGVAPSVDLALTRAMLHYLADLRVGRVPSEYHSAMPDTRLQTFDPVEQLRSALAEDKLPAAVEAAQPGVPFYRPVREALATYRALAARGHRMLPPANRLQPGSPYAGAARLRERLVLFGDLDAGAARSPAGIYSAGLAEGVRHFQLRHGLAQDGILGNETIAALNVPARRRVRQLELTLERLRRLPEIQAGPLIAVNVPTFRLWAFELGAGDPQPSLEMRVIVGKAARTQTPLFIGQMRYLEFNPYWNVPHSIALEEILPALSRNSNYLAANDMELVPAGGGKPSVAMNSAAIEAVRTGKARIRQRPGPKNVLGQVKFAMPNPMNIYLHSTSARELFERSRRDLSHGCIRVEKPLELAHFVLADQPGWDLDAVRAAMAPAPMRKVELSAPVPVVLFYATALVDREGRVLFARDVYHRDPLLEKSLAAHRDGHWQAAP